MEELGSNLQEQIIMIAEHPKYTANKKKVRILAISDTHHNHHLIDIKSWPQADIFIHAGDFTITSTRQQFKNFREFLAKLPYKHKIVVPGNHDFGLEPSQELCNQVSGWWEIPKNQIVNSSQQIKKLKSVCTYLVHDFVEVQGIKIFGTPHVWYEYELAFTRPSIANNQIWKKLPAKLDVLITHIPPYGIRDITHQKHNVGCKRLLNNVNKIEPKVHIFGHIHQSYGNVMVGKTHFYNVCYLDELYKAKNKPVLIEIQV